MSKEKEESLLKAILPEGILEYFEITDIQQHPDSHDIFLEERNIHPEEYQGQKLISKGFFEPISVQDFPIRGKAVYLKIRRRKWLNENTGLNVYRDWQLVANGTRLTGEFAAFLKVLVRYQAR